MKIERLDMELDDDAACRLVGGRVGAMAAIGVFIAVYVAGLVHYGWLLGIGLGWLTAGIAGYVAAHGVASVTTAFLRLAVASARLLTTHHIGLHR